MMNNKFRKDSSTRRLACVVCVNVYWFVDLMMDDDNKGHHVPPNNIAKPNLISSV